MVRACQKPCFVTMGRRPRRGRLPIVPSGVPVVSRVRFVLPPSSASHAVGNGIPARRGDGRDGGGWGIRTPEGLHPTRFPSVRHRPLGESSGCSAQPAAACRPRATDMEYIGRLRGGASRLRWHRSRAFPDLRAPRGGRGGPDLGYTHPRPLVRRHPANPPGPEGSKGKQALAGARGVLTCPGGGEVGLLRSPACTRPVLHEGGGALAKGCAYCTSPRTSGSAPDLHPVAPDPRAVPSRIRPWWRRPPPGGR